MGTYVAEHLTADLGAELGLEGRFRRRRRPARGTLHCAELGKYPTAHLVGAGAASAGGFDDRFGRGTLDPHIPGHLSGGKK